MTEENDSRPAAPGGERNGGQVGHGGRIAPWYEQEWEPREVHLWQYWAIVVKWRLLIGVVAALAVAATLLSAFFSQRLYMASATIDVEPDRGNILDIGQGSQMWQSYNPDFLATQTMIITNRDVARKAVEKLNLIENPVFNPRRSGIVKKITGSGPERAVPGAADQLNMLAARVQGGLSVRNRRGTNLVDLSYVSPDPKLAAEIVNAVAGAYVEWTLEAKYRTLAQASQFLSAQIEQLKSEIEEKEAKLQAYGRQKDISEDPQANLTVQKLTALNRDYSVALADRVSKESRLFEIQGARPEAIADTISGGTVAQLRNEQMKLEKEYEEKLAIFKPEWPAMQQLKVQIEKGRENLGRVVQDTVEKAKEQAKAEYQMAVRREETLKGALSQQKVEAMAQSANTTEYNNLRVEVVTKRMLRDTLMRRQGETEMTSRLHGGGEAAVRIVDLALPPGGPFTPNYRRALSTGFAVGLAIGLGLAFLIEYLDRSIRTPEQVEDTLRMPSLGVIPAVGATGTVPRTLRRLYDYSRRHRGGGAYAYGGGYGYGYGSGSGLSKKGKAAEAGKKGRQSREEVPDAYLSDAPPGPNRGAESPAGAVPIELMPHKYPRSAVAEAYRTFRNALLLSRAGGVKTIVITSSLQYEGKTATAVNLAVVLGQLGKKVLLVDVDLHRRRVHEVLGVSNKVGLVTLLTDARVKGADAIQATSIPNVAVMTAGPSSPNPSALVTSEGMTRILKAARDRFDYVVLDSPPILIVSDSMLLGHEADGVVLCVRAGMTPREDAIQARDRLARSGANVLGVVLNGFGEGITMGRYGGAGYGYGYGKKDGEPEAAGVKAGGDLGEGAARSSPA